MYVCIYVCRGVCKYVPRGVCVCVYTYIRIRMHVYSYVFLSVGIHVCTYIRTYVCMCVCKHTTWTRICVFRPPLIFLRRSPNPQLGFQQGWSWRDNGQVSCDARWAGGITEKVERQICEGYSSSNYIHIMDAGGSGVVTMLGNVPTAFRKPLSLITRHMVFSRPLCS